MTPRLGSRRSALAAAFGLLLCSGCDETQPEPEVPSCELRHTGRVLQGRWTLEGRGRREGCGDRRLEGDLRLRTSMPIDVSAAAPATAGSGSFAEPEFEADAFVDRLDRADFVLSLSDADSPDAATDPGDITLIGATNGSCVAFDLRETLEDGDALDYQFDGFITASNHVEGEFHGSGPERCEVRGSFTLTIR